MNKDIYKRRIEECVCMRMHMCACAKNAKMKCVKPTLGRFEINKIKNENQIKTNVKDTHYRNYRNNTQVLYRVTSNKTRIL